MLKNDKQNVVINYIKNGFDFFELEKVFDSLIEDIVWFWLD